MQTVKHGAKSRRHSWKAAEYEGTLLKTPPVPPEEGAAIRRDLVILNTFKTSFAPLYACSSWVCKPPYCICQETHVFNIKPSSFPLYCPGKFNTTRDGTTTPGRVTSFSLFPGPWSESHGYCSWLRPTPAQDGLGLDGTTETPRTHGYDLAQSKGSVQMETWSTPLCLLCVPLLLCRL